MILCLCSVIEIFMTLFEVGKYQKTFGYASCFHQAFFPLK